MLVLPPMRLLVIFGILWTGGVVQFASAEEALKITILSKPTEPEKNGQRILRVQTAVGAMCLGNVSREVNPNQRAKLDLKNVDREGKVSWDWPVEMEISKGRWFLSIQCATSKKDDRFDGKLDFGE